MKKNNQKTRINQNIKSKSVRLIDENGENKGTVLLTDAIEQAQRLELDVIEISSNTKPPIVKILDYGKWQYINKKRARADTSKKKSVSGDIKTLQIKVVTGDNAKKIRAKQINEWIKDGHRVKIDLFLSGRYKYMDENFLKARLVSFVKLIQEEYNVVEEIKRSAKGFSFLIQGAKNKNDKNNKSSKIPNKDNEK